MMHELTAVNDVEDRVAYQFLLTAAVFGPWTT